MIEFTTEYGPADEVTIIKEGHSGSITDMLAALTALVLVALASFPLIEAQRAEPGAASAAHSSIAAQSQDMR